MMKQMFTVSGGVFFATAIMSLIVGGGYFVQKVQFQNELENRGQVSKTISEWSGFEEFNNQKSEKIQDAISTSVLIAGITGSIGIGLAFAGKSKTT